MSLQDPSPHNHQEREAWSASFEKTSDLEPPCLGLGEGPLAPVAVDPTQSREDIRGAAAGAIARAKRWGRSWQIMGCSTTHRNECLDMSTAVMGRRFEE